MKTHLFSSRSKGFTLVELLVVISIIVILTGIIITNLAGSRGKARDAQRVSDLGQLQLALALFVDRCNQYPTGSSLSTASTASSCPTNTSTGAAYKLGDFIGQVPVPPSGASQNAYDYTYYRLSSTGNRVNYILHAKLEGSNAAVAKGLAASSITDPSSTLNPSPYGWSQAADAAPYSSCSNSAASVDYCIGPN